MSTIVELIYDAEMTIPEVACYIVAFVVSLEFIATIVSSLSRMGR